MRSSNAFALIACWLLATIPGCGARYVGERRPEPMPAHTAAELDQLEHTIEEEQRTLETLDPAACPDRCRSVESICEASARICVLSSEIGGDEVALRCARAERACDEARGGTDPGCGCATAADAAVAACTGPARF